MACSPHMDSNTLIIFIAKGFRNFSYGALSIPIILYLKLIGVTHEELGVLITISLLGNLIICFCLSSHADKLGRKNVMLVCSIMKFLSGGIFAFCSNIYLLILGGVIGTISLSGTEIGPFLSIEQAILSDLIQKQEDDEFDQQAQMANIMGWYNSVGFIANALGAGFASVLISALEKKGWSEVSSYRMIVLAYGFLGFLGFVFYLMLNSNAEVQNTSAESLTEESEPPITLKNFLMMGFSCPETFKIMMILGVLFAIDAFAGNLVPASYISYWYHTNWLLSMEAVGIIIMASNIISGIGALLASYFVGSFGVIKVLVFTHLPTHVLSILIPLMPSKQLSITMFVLRGFASNMNVSSKQTYILSLAKSSEKSAAGSLYVTSKSLGQIFSPIPLSYMMDSSSNSVQSLPFIMSAVIKTCFDLGIWMFSVFVMSHSQRHRQHEMGKEEAKLPELQKEQSIKIKSQPISAQINSAN